MFMSTYTMVQTCFLSLTGPLRYGNLWEMLSCLLPQMLSLFWCTPCLYFCFLFCQLWSTPKILISSCNKCIDLMEDWKLSWEIKVKHKGIGFYIAGLFPVLLNACFGCSLLSYTVSAIWNEVCLLSSLFLVGNLPGQSVFSFIRVIAGCEFPYAFCGGLGL